MVNAENQVLETKDKKFTFCQSCNDCLTLTFYGMVAALSGGVVQVKYWLEGWFSIVFHATRKVSRHSHASGVHYFKGCEARKTAGPTLKNKVRDSDFVTTMNKLVIVTNNM